MHNKSIDTNPMKALIGVESRSVAVARLLEEVREIVHQLDLAKLRGRMKENIERKQQEQKERYDRAAMTYKAGALIFVRITSDPIMGSSRKLHPKFKRLFRIRKVLMNDRYEVEDLREGYKRDRTIVAADNIKPWITFQDEGLPVMNCTPTAEESANKKGCNDRN